MAMTKKQKKITTICAVAVVVIIALFMYHSLFGHQFDIEEKAYIYIDDDDNIDSLRTKISEAGKPSNLVGFNLLASIYNIDKKIKPGRYSIEPGNNAVDMVRKIRNHSQDPVNLVIPSVRTVDDLAGRLSRYLLLDSAKISDALHDEDVCEKYGYDTQNISCMFIPNTYQVYWNISLDDLLDRMKKESDTFWNDERKAKAKKAGLSQNEVITLASIVDEETANNGEKSRIAGLYMNRLKAGMPLQSDPTVKYALGDFSLKRIMHGHLNTDSPYNTYKNEGLPPGPIRIPSIAGIDAVLNYEHHNFMYMCAKEDFSGTHNFAVTYDQHLTFAKKYADALNARGIK